MRLAQPPRRFLIFYKLVEAMTSNVEVAALLFVRRFGDDVAEVERREWEADAIQDALLVAWEDVIRRLDSGSDPVDIVLSVEIRTERGKYRRPFKRRSLPSDRTHPVELLELLDDDDRKLADLALRGASAGMISRRTKWPEYLCSDSQVWQSVDKLILLAWLRMQVIDTAEGIYSLAIFSSIRTPKVCNHTPLLISKADAEACAATTIDAESYSVVASK